MKRLFVDNTKNEQLAEQGYTTLPLLNNSDIQFLENTYHQETREKLPGFHPTMFHQDSMYRKKLNDVIDHILIALKDLIQVGQIK